MADSISEKQNLITQPLFNVRPILQSDAAAIHSIDAHCKTSARADRASLSDISEVKANTLRSPNGPERVHLMAYSTVGDQGILGYIIMLPYMDAVQGPRIGYERAATISLWTLEEGFLGAELYHSVNTALITEALAMSRKRQLKYQTVVTTMLFRKDQPSLESYRNVLFDSLFKQVGCLSEIMEKDGMLFDRITFQRGV
jgi:hypothetical protein